MNAFQVCEPLRAALDALPFDEAAQPAQQAGWTTTLIWPDEDPCDGFIQCHMECHQAFQDLLQARAEFWKQGEVSEALQPLWSDARQRVGGWPGFRRLFLSAAELDRLAEAEEFAVQVNAMMFQAADEVCLEVDAAGNPRAACYFNLAPEDQPEAAPAKRRPWWQFWGWLAERGTSAFRARRRRDPGR